MVGCPPLRLCCFQVNLHCLELGGSLCLRHPFTQRAKPYGGRCHLGRSHLGRCHLGRCNGGRCNGGRCHLGRCHLGRSHLGRCHLGRCNGGRCNGGRCHLGRCHLGRCHGSGCHHLGRSHHLGRCHLGGCDGARHRVRDRRRLSLAAQCLDDGLHAVRIGTGSSPALLCHLHLLEGDQVLDVPDQALLFVVCCIAWQREPAGQVGQPGGPVHA